ncbi:hypothetical protein SDC9_193933 [bioreactor metagenome]|uniref:Uncharacterized protein n=1 Tax=bioreactor metagenome TaxID=1076179 RepID=A0A645I4X0_9ZZZZ
MPHGTDARAGGAHDVVIAGEGLHVVADVGHRSIEVAGVGEHLAAAGLVERELHPAAQPLEHLDDGLRRTREHHVVDTGGEQRDGDALRMDRHRSSSPTPVSGSSSYWSDHF